MLAEERREEKDSQPGMREALWVPREALAAGAGDSGNRTLAHIQYDREKSAVNSLAHASGASQASALPARRYSAVW